MPSEHVDVLVVGAGISGICAGYYLETHCPNRTYAILEGRSALGGTWELFRYPGIRSDSDMFTLGYSFRPWKAAKAIADGPDILKYLTETAREHGIDAKIRYQHRVVGASWSTEAGRWTVSVECGPERERKEFTCTFLHFCSGYYRYSAGYTPELPGIDRFRGTVIHPQLWDENLDYAGRRVVVIGSGATAVTLVPAMAETAAHVTMLQRSPTWVISRPGRDPIADWLRENLPERLAHALARAKGVLLGMLFYRLSRKNPARARRFLLGELAKQLPPEQIREHFTPSYNPWDQRVCLVPDGDLFVALREGRASVVTDHIETFTETALRLRSGKELPADLVVTATGLALEPLGGITLTVDGAPVRLSERMAYKGMLLENVPNLAHSVGYTNASWTLKAELTCAYVCRILNHLAATGHRYCVPRPRDPALTDEPWVNFTSGYVLRSLDKFPRQGSKAPWRLYQNYALDLVSLKLGAIEDGDLEFAS